MTLTIESSFLWNDTVWNPSMIQTALWLDAADASTITESSGLVSQINDKSGNGRNFTASSTARPTLTSDALNNRSVLTFGGSQYLTSANAATTWNFLHQAGGAEVIGVWKAGNTPDPNTLYGFWGTSAGTVLNEGIYQRWDDRASSSFNNAVIIAAKNANVSGGFCLDVSANDAHSANAATILGASLDLGNATAANKIRHVVNGTVLAGTNTSTDPASTSNAAFTLQLGAVGNNALPLTGFVAEFIACPTQLSAINRQRLEGYLAHKWGLTANLPAGHPYKDYGPKP